jgi:two-component system, OmpR family, phosphate regulon response regulator OmpR
MSETHVLLVDDDVELGSVLTEYFATHGVALEHALSGSEARIRLGGARFSVILLDVMLPNEDGFQLLPEFCKLAPVIMLTARGESDDRIRGLELGARDYLPKPFNPKELLLRIRSVARDAHDPRVAAVAGEVIHVGALLLRPNSQRVSLGELALDLTAFEYRVLEVLARAAGSALTREQIAAAVGMNDYDPSVDRSLDVHVSNLRQKLDTAQAARSANQRTERAAEKWIRTLRGVGYMLIRPE